MTDSATTGYMNFRNVQVELSNDNSTWVSIAGSFSSVDVDGGEREVIEFVPLFSDTVKAKYGRRDRVRLKVKGVYTEISDEAFRILDAAYRGNLPTYMRWTPAGDVPGAYRYFAVNAKVTKPFFPGGEVDEPKPITFDFTLDAEMIDKEIKA